MVCACTCLRRQRSLWLFDPLLSGGAGALWRMEKMSVILVPAHYMHFPYPPRQYSICDLFYYRDKGRAYI